ncbi:hypothetical protein F5Y15DRAFT_49791 [Xylariaceae sp. FL0016]|nr:hypothetical protein F5Y15DRAFT_49791 [Xylariaceae sp. FL0016]
MHSTSWPGPGSPGRSGWEERALVRLVSLNAVSHRLSGWKADEGGIIMLTGLLAVVAKALSRGADLGIVANVATLVACSSREGRHGEKSGSLRSHCQPGTS